ncbi:MAG: hypothetical protein ACYTF5_11580, partial [Planctomycetota bacterium]
HRAVIKAFSEEMEKSEAEGYQPPTFDDLDEVGDFLDESYLEELARREEARVRTREQTHKDSGQISEQGI